MDIATLGIRISTSGVREAQRDLGQLAKTSAATERSVQGLRDTASKALGPALAGVGVAAAVAVSALRRYVQNTIEAEQVQAQLAARLKSTAGAAGLTASQLNLQADALQKLTTFDDEAITGAQSLLLTFTKVGRDVFPRATAAVLDLATGLGTDLKSAALQVGKALNDPVQGVTALSRAGVQFSESQRETIRRLVETGETAQAQAIILAELETQFGGAAKAARNTFGGALQSLNNTIDNLLEGNGDGGLRGARDAIESLNRTLNDPEIKRGIDAVAEGVLAVANAAIKAAAAIGKVAAAYRDFLATRGLLKIDANSTASEIQARRVRVTGVLERVESGRTIFGQDTARKLRQELNAIAAQVDPKTPLERALGLDKLVGGQRFSAVPFSAVDFSKRPAAAGNDDDEEKRDRTRAVGRSLLARVTKELSEEEKRLADVMEVNALIDEQAADAARALFFQRQAAIEAAEEVRLQNEGIVTSYREELRLLGLSREERAAEIAQRQLSADATDAQRAAVRALAIEQERALDQAQLLDGFRGSLEDTFTSIVTGAQSAKDAFKALFDEIAAQITRAIARNAVESLLGSYGSSGGGSAGGGFAALLSGLFGGGRAIGGPVTAGRLYEVGERGNELFVSGGRNYLIPGKSGKVTPEAPRARGGDFSQNVNITIAERTDRRTLQQIEFATGKAARRAMARNG